MSNESNEEATGNYPMERRLIRVDNLPDQAGITAALRRAFGERTERVECDNDDSFADLLERIH